MKTKPVSWHRMAFMLALLWLVLPNFPALTQSQTHENEKSCLWKVQSSDNPAMSVYLLGSIHLLKEENYPLKPALLEAYNAASTLFFEIHLDSAETPETQLQFLTRGLYTDDNSLEKSLTGQTYAEAKKIADSLGLSIEAMGKFKPWFFSMTVMTLKLAQLGFKPEFGIDRWFFEKAKQEQKNIKGLETIDFQLDLFDQVDSTHSEEFVAQTFDEFDMIAGELDTLVTAWQNGDTGQLEKILLKSFRDYPPLYQAFIVRRNQNWLPIIEALFEQQENCMVIVGCGHLIGEDGLVKMLNDLGYSIQQF